MWIIAVDPGKSGGVAIRDSCTKLVTTHKMPETERDLVDLLGNAVTVDRGVEVVLYCEEVGGFIGEEQPGSAMFKFGWWAAAPVWIAHCYQIKIVMVRPQKWMKHLSLGTRGGRSKTEWKNFLKGKAQQRYPEQKVTLATADALLILQYAIDLEK